MAMAPATQARLVEIGGLALANDRPFVLIAGPCQLESRDHALETSAALAEMTARLGIGRASCRERVYDDV